MFERYSIRTRRVIFMTRMRAGHLGSATIETKHLVEALVLEDQGELDKLLPGARVFVNEPSMVPARSFFSADQAAAILRGLEEPSSSQHPVADSVDMALSEEAKLILTSAVELADSMHDSEVEPLHLLAEILSKAAGDVTKVVTNAGVSSQTVLAATRSGGFL